MIFRLFIYSQLSKFTQMNLWTHYVYWSREYPKGPDDTVCNKSQQRKRDQTVVFNQEAVDAATDSKDQLF